MLNKDGGPGLITFFTNTINEKITSIYSKKKSSCELKISLFVMSRAISPSYRHVLSFITKVQLFVLAGLTLKLTVLFVSQLSTSCTWPLKNFAYILHYKQSSYNFICRFFTDFAEQPIVHSLSNGIFNIIWESLSKVFSHNYKLLSNSFVRSLFEFACTVRHRFYDTHVDEIDRMSNKFITAIGIYWEETYLWQLPVIDSNC